MGTLGKRRDGGITTDVVELLTAQHLHVDELIAQLEQGDGDHREVFAQLANSVAAHATMEEKLFYPAVMAKETTELLRESVEEHLSIKRLLADLLELRPGEDAFAAKLSVLKEQLAHHAHEEEEGKLFPEVRRMLSADERAALGGEALRMFEELMAASPARSVPGETEIAAPLPRA